MRPAAGHKPGDPTPSTATSPGAGLALAATASGLYKLGVAPYALGCWPRLAQVTPPLPVSRGRSMSQTPPAAGAERTLYDMVMQGAGFGTLSGYGAGGCGCRNCKDACAIYRANRCAAGKAGGGPSNLRHVMGIQRSR
jgi:hypothetical protein